MTIPNRIARPIQLLLIGAAMALIADRTIEWTNEYATQRAAENAELWRE